jgi:hypothetical protein
MFVVEIVGESDGGVGKLLLSEGVQLGQSLGKKNSEAVGNAVGKQVV